MNALKLPANGRSAFGRQPEIGIHSDVANLVINLKQPLFKILEYNEVLTSKPSFGNSVYGKKVATEVIRLNAQKISDLIDEIMTIEKEKMRKEKEPIIMQILDQWPQYGRITNNISQPDKDWLKEIEEIVFSEMADRAIKLSSLAYRVAVSERQLHRRINKLIGMTPNRYICCLKLYRAYQLLENRTYSTVLEVAGEVGFRDPHYFSKVYKSFTGKMPSDYF